MIEHIIEDAIKRVAKGFTEFENLDFVCPGLFEKVCETTHWKFELDDYGYNGWEVDWWGTIIIDSITISISGCMYYGTAHLELNNG